MLIGIDFDNTIVSYDTLFHREALVAGLIDAELPKSKIMVRQQIWEEHDDLTWQKLQGQVYGPKMAAAELIPGVHEFLCFCKTQTIPVCIVSHKTEFGHFDESRTKLREAALDWMDVQKLFQTNQTGLSHKQVYFEPTREKKIERINALGCSHFIDDLPDVLLDTNLSPQIRRIHYCQEKPPHNHNLTCCANWREISALIEKEAC